MRTTLLFAALYAASVLTVPSAAAEPTLADIIEAVRQNEVLYERIDFTIRGKYQTFNREWKWKKQPETATPDGPITSREVLAEDWTLRVVYQGPYFRLDRPTRHVYSETEAKEMPYIFAYDGEKTRMLIDQIGNVSQGFAIHKIFPTPHTLLAFEYVRVPLSAYLAGDEAIRQYPKGRRLHDGYSVRVSYEGVEECNGLRCHKVHVVTSAGGREGGRNEFWLAEERNYIVARTVCYSYWISTDQPTSCGEVGEWREVEPGIWIPSRIVENAFFVGTMAPAAPNARFPNWRKEITLEAVKLNPQYEVDFFRFDFPPGTAVYELEGSEIKHSYRAAAPPARAGDSGASPSTLAWRLAGLAAACVAALVLFFAVKWQRRRQNRSLPVVSR